MPLEDNETPVPMPAQSLSAPVPDESREGPNYDADDNQGEHMPQATALSQPLPDRVIDEPLEELPGDFGLLDGVDEEGRRAT